MQALQRLAKTIITGRGWSILHVNYKCCFSWFLSAISTHRCKGVALCNTVVTLFSKSPCYFTLFSLQSVFLLFCGSGWLYHRNAVQYLILWLQFRTLSPFLLGSFSFPFFKTELSTVGCRCTEQNDTAGSGGGWYTTKPLHMYYMVALHWRGPRNDTYMTTESFCNGQYFNGQYTFSDVFVMSVFKIHFLLFRNVKAQVVDQVRGV